MKILFRHADFLRLFTVRVQDVLDGSRLVERKMTISKLVLAAPVAFINFFRGRKIVRIDHLIHW